MIVLTCDRLYDVISGHVNRRQVSAIKMELLELQCAEEKYSTLLGLVTEPVSRMSTCRLPPAVSDLSDFAFQVCCLFSSFHLSSKTLCLRILSVEDRHKCADHTDTLCGSIMSSVLARNSLKQQFRVVDSGSQLVSRDWSIGGQASL